MREQDAWSILGISPGTDARAIRRAYAGQLKVIDVEADPQAFIRLREAFERALLESSWVDDEPSQNVSILLERSSNHPIPENTLEVGQPEYSDDDDDDVEDEDDWDNWDDWRPYDCETAQQNLGSAELSRLYDIVLGGEGEREPVDEYEVDALVQAVWSAPENQQIDRYEEIESFLGHLITSRPHRARFLLRKANWYYRWSKLESDVVESALDRDDMREWAQAERLLGSMENDHYPGEAAIIVKFRAGPTGHKWRDRWQATKMNELKERLIRSRYDAMELFSLDQRAAWNGIEPIRPRWDIIIMVAGLAPVAAAIVASVGAEPVSLAFFAAVYVLYAGLGTLYLIWIHRAKTRYQTLQRETAIWNEDLPLSLSEGVSTALLLLLLMVAPYWPVEFVPSMTILITIFCLVVASGLLWSITEAGTNLRYSILLVIYIVITTSRAPFNPPPFNDWMMMLPAGGAFFAFGMGQPRLFQSWNRAPAGLVMVCRSIILIAATLLLIWLVSQNHFQETPAFLIWPMTMLIVLQDALGESEDGPYRLNILGFNLTLTPILVSIVFVPSITILVLVIRRMAARLIEQYNAYQGSEATP